MSAIVIIGAGEVGYHLADILSREEHRVSVIDHNPATARRLMEALDVQVVVGDGTRANVLNDAGASRADLAIAVTDSDLVNMVACRLAKEMGAKRTILRLREARNLTGYHYFYKRALGFDVVLSTNELAATEILSTVREHHALEVESFADGRIQVRRVRIPEECPLVNRPLRDLSLPEGVLLCGVARREEFFVPTGDDWLAPHDQVYTIGSGRDLDAFERAIGTERVGLRSVVVMGAGALGRELAAKLVDVPGVQTRVIENDPARARSLAAEGLSGVLVLEGDATDLDLLLEERIGDANVFIAASGDDERNMVACQLARSLGAERTVALVHKASYRQIYDLLGIDLAVSPRVLCSNRILRFVRSASVFSIAVLGEGRAEVIEIEVRVKKKRGAVPVRSLGLPKGAVLGAIVREDEVLVPHGDTILRDHDRVIVFTLPEKVERVLAVLQSVSP